MQEDWRAMIIMQGLLRQWTLNLADFRLVEAGMWIDV
jgi:hypothetical protein